MKKVVVGIISRKFGDLDKYLLISAKKDFGKFTGFYYPPGGHVEDGEEICDALIRELDEELGLKATPITKIMESAGDVPDQITYWWECKINSDEKIRFKDNTISDIKWFTKEEIINMNNCWPATKNFFSNYIK